MFLLFLGWNDGYIDGVIVIDCAPVRYQNNPKTNESSSWNVLVRVMNFDTFLNLMNDIRKLNIHYTHMLKHSNSFIKRVKKVQTIHMFIVRSRSNQDPPYSLETLRKHHSTHPITSYIQTTVWNQILLVTCQDVEKP